MRVCVTTEQRFVRTPDKRFWASAASPYSFWRRYLDAFDEVRVIARVADAAEPAPSWKRADGEGVTFESVPYYVGPYQYLLRLRPIHKAVREAVGPADALILRVGSQIAACLEPVLRTGRPFGLEVVGDPYGFFAPGSVSHPLRPFFRWLFTRRLRRQCQRASAVAYVTSGFLQHRYPPSETAFCTSYSSVELGEDAFVMAPRSFDRQSGPMRVVSVASLELPNKGVDVLIDAAATCIQQGSELELVFIGDGRCRSEYERRVVRRRIGGHVCFLGTIPTGRPVRDQLDRAQLFVLAVKGGDGLPRAMIEAMARGVPCVGSAVAGIPELLPPEDLVPRGDANALARKIREVLNHPERMARMSAANLARAREYGDSVLGVRRREFYVHLRRATQEWLRRVP